MNPARITATFIQHASRPSNERTWLKTTFSLMLKVARRNKQFTMDDIWAEIDKAYATGALPGIDIDHRILGPMLQHLVRENVIASSGYFTRSIRSGGGSRPVTVWTSFIYKKSLAAA